MVIQKLLSLVQYNRLFWIIDLFGIIDQSYCACRVMYAMIYARTRVCTMQNKKTTFRAGKK